MRKISIFVLQMMFISIILLGCQSDDKSKVPIIEISKVSISNSTGFGKVNSDFFKVYDDNDTLEVFQNMFSKAVKRNGVADMSSPEFDLEVIYKDGTVQGYHLWMGERDQTSTIMNVDDTHTTYSIPEEVTNQLLELVKLEIK